MTHRVRKSLLMEDHVCPWWLAYTFDNPLRRLIHNPQKMLARLLDRGQTALDIGCGMGFFTLAMARLVGEEGRVIAADLQPQMLARVSGRAEQAGLLSRIRLHPCPSPDRLGLTETVDFALAFWMVHEVPDTAQFLSECRQLLKPGARLLVVEPKLHVPLARFEHMVELARTAGLQPGPGPQVALSRAVLLQST